MFKGIFIGASDTLVHVWYLIIQKMSSNICFLFFKHLWKQNRATGIQMSLYTFWPVGYSRNKQANIILCAPETCMSFLTLEHAAPFHQLTTGSAEIKKNSNSATLKRPSWLLSTSGSTMIHPRLLDRARVQLWLSRHQESRVEKVQ